MASGAEFNPLREVNRYGEQNPYQDPRRGRFDVIQADAEGKISSTQEKLMQNLGGDDSIIGRSIHLTNIPLLLSGYPRP